MFTAKTSQTPSRRLRRRLWTGQSEDLAYNCRCGPHSIHRQNSIWPIPPIPIQSFELSNNSACHVSSKIIERHACAAQPRNAQFPDNLSNICQKLTQKLYSQRESECALTADKSARGWNAREPNDCWMLELSFFGLALF